MKNGFVDEPEAADIEALIDKVIRGLGNPEPPLDLTSVRELLRLDRRYFSTTDRSAVSEFVSRIRIAGIQVFERPLLLWEAIRKADISALYIPDKKRILIDTNLPALKHRWAEAHEIGHSLIPWHQEMLLGDNEYSLKRECHEILEMEANFAAGQLLFLQKRFHTEAADYRPEWATVQTLKGRFGNTLSSTLWRYVEEVGKTIPLVGMISGHPRRPAADFDPAAPCKHCIQSPMFSEQFSKVSEVSLFRIISSYCRGASAGPLGEADAVLCDDRGDRCEFHFESFSNSYEVLTLGSFIGRVSPQSLVV